MLQLQSTEAGQVNPEYIESQHEIEHRMQSFMPVSSNDITLVCHPHQQSIVHWIPYQLSCLNKILVHSQK